MTAACSQCDAPSTGTLARLEYCDLHRAEIVDPIRKKVILPEGHDGIGEIVAPRSDWGREWFDLRCDRCSAEWVGRAGEACEWCAGRADRIIGEQASLLLHPDLPDHDDPRFDAVASGWVDRIGRAVEAGVIDERTARSAAARIEVRHAA